MATLLRRVLEAFEQTETTIRLDALCRELEVDPGTLDNMIQHWVRKGRIREVIDAPAGAGCHGCGVQAECPFVMRLPKRYALARGVEDPMTCPACVLCPRAD
jgi:hypothetical protein